MRKQLGWSVANIAVLGYALIPVVWIVSLSLKPAAYVKDGNFIPRTFTLDNYRSVFRTGDFGSALINSVGIGLLATLLALVVGVLAAYALSRSEIRGKNIILGLILLVAMFPQISLVTPLFNIERQVHLFDTWPGLILPYAAFGLPLAIYTMSSYFQQIPPDLEKAAMMDGASPWVTLRKVIFPLAGPGIVTAAILVFITCWNDLLFAMALTASDSAETAPAAIASFTGSSQFEEPTGSIAAAAVIITIPIIVFVVIFQRKIVSGLTSGAVKG